MAQDPFFIQHENIYAVPILHYCMECAAEVHFVFKELRPDCVAVELAEPFDQTLQHATSRLPDISVITATSSTQNPIHYLCEPCDPAFEALRSAQDANIPAYCIDLDVENYPNLSDPLPDPYAIHRIGLKEYYAIYKKFISTKESTPTKQDISRETYMAKRLKELSLRYDRVLFVGGMVHIERIIKSISHKSFPPFDHAERTSVELATLTEASCREVMGESGWISTHYEKMRGSKRPDRQKLIYLMYKQAGEKYTETTGNPFPGYHMRNLMKYARNYSFIADRLMPNLFQQLTVAKGCVDHNYAYETWLLATTYPHLKNIDNLPELNLSVEEVWGDSKYIRFHLKQKREKGLGFRVRRKDITNHRFEPPLPFTICSYPPEDLAIEKFGEFLQKKGTQILTEEAARTIPFSTSIEDGVDTRETIRHWHEKKLYVKVKGKPPGGVGSIVMIFDEDAPNEGESYTEKYPWRTTWLGEHEQESDMALYATSTRDNCVGPGISRCQYGGFMMSYPPRRMYDVWQDPDYAPCRTKAEVLLMAAIDYAVKPLIVYCASKPPRGELKSFASRFGKKIIYIPIGQLSSITLNKIRAFHVLDGHDKRGIADEYII